MVILTQQLGASTYQGDCHGGPPHRIIMRLARTLNDLRLLAKTLANSVFWKGRCRLSPLTPLSNVTCMSTMITGLVHPHPRWRMFVSGMERSTIYSSINAMARLPGYARLTAIRRLTPSPATSPRGSKRVVRHGGPLPIQQPLILVSCPGSPVLAEIPKDCNLDSPRNLFPWKLIHKRR